MYWIFYIFLFTKSVLKEQWIRAKYERKEFVDGAPEPPYLKGTLWANLQMCTHYPVNTAISPHSLPLGLFHERDVCTSVTGITY